MDTEHPSFGEVPPIERPFRLEDLLSSRLPGVLFLDAEDDDEEMTSLYGEHGPTIAPVFGRLCNSLRSLKRTGKVDLASLREDGKVLDLLLAGVQREEREVREQLRRDHPEIAKIARMGEKHFGKDYSKMFNDVSIIKYGRYLDLSCARTVLELMRGGVDAIAGISQQGPSLPPRH